MRTLKLGTCVLAVVLASTGWAQVNQRMSVDSRGVQGDDSSIAQSISGDGRYVAFMSWATNLVHGDTNGVDDIFVRDRVLGTTERINVSSSGAQANDYSQEPAISADGQFIAFESAATNLVSVAVQGWQDVYVRDRMNGTTELVSVSSGGQPGDSGSAGASISGDGRYVAFSGYSQNLVPGDTNGRTDVFVRDRQAGTTERVSLAWTGAQGNGNSYQPSISFDGRYVAFVSEASNLGPGDTNGVVDIFVRDRLSGTTERVSVSSDGTQADDHSFQLSISFDGRYVAFSSVATNLVPGDTNGTTDVFIHDRLHGITKRASVSSSGAPGNSYSYVPRISGDGRYVTFESEATNLVPGDTNQCPDIFLYDRRFGTTERVNLEPDGSQGHISGYGLYPVVSEDGRFVAFNSSANDLVGGDTNGTADVYLRDRLHGPFASLCEPDFSGVIPCPCNNPPSGPEQGCNNSSGTGGASLLVSGGEYLSSDTIVFDVSGVNPNALSILLQGTQSISAGSIYGHGVRCVGGSLKRLYVVTASSGGRITVPYILAGQPLVHERSEDLGDPILAGTTRWYSVVYRDPAVLGSCTASSAFNTTQTREIRWLP